MNILMSLIIVASVHHVKKFNSVTEFVNNVKSQDTFVFYEVFPRYDTTKSNHNIKAFAGYTNKYLLFLFEIDSINPISGTRGYDSRDIYNGDFVGLSLATFKSKEFAYHFLASPGEGQSDFLLTQYGFSGKEWDGLWNFKNINKKDNKWVSLFIIPFKSIFYRDSVFFIKLFTNLYLTNTLFATNYNQPLNATYNMEELVLSGFNLKKSGIKISTIPYLRTEKFADTAKLKVNGGGIIELKPNFYTLLSAVYNPDFSTVDLDVTSLDVNIYPRYYPEKRKFFTDGSSKFDFSLPVYYSRNIDTLRLGMRGIYDKEKYSFYGIYADYNNHNKFAGLGINRQKLFRHFDTYVRILKDDSIVLSVLGLNYYIPFISAMLNAEGGCNFENRNKAFIVSFSRDRYPGLGIHMSFQSIDTSFVSKVGMPWYNNTLQASGYVTYSWILKNSPDWRPSVMFYAENLYNKVPRLSLYRERSAKVQIIAPHNIYASIGIRENIYGSAVGEMRWLGVPLGGGVFTRFISPSVYYFYDVENKNNFITLSSGFHIKGSTMNLSFSSKRINGASDSTIVTLYGEMPVYKKFLIKPFIEYKRYTQYSGSSIDSNVHLNLREFIYINRFTQIAFLQDFLYDLERKRAVDKSFLMRLQLYLQIL